MATDTSHIMVLAPVGDREQASIIARTLIERELAACVQTLPIKSCYKWEGEIVEEVEHLLFIKSRREVYDRLEACVKELHSYEVPEIVALPIVLGSDAYLKWLDSVVSL